MDYSCFKKSSSLMEEEGFAFLLANLFNDISLINSICFF